MYTLYGDGIHDDTPAIQELLDTQKDVTLPMPKVRYLISKPLEFASYTRLVLPRYAEIRLAPMSDCVMAKNKTVESRAQRCKSKIYEFVNRYSPDAPCHDIEIVGGVWNYNNKEQRPNPSQTGDYGPNGDYNGFIFLFFNVRNLRLSSMTMKDPVTYAALLDTVSYFTVDHIIFDFNYGNPVPVNMDGIHCNGNCHYGEMTNLKGTCYDDLVALNADEGSSGPITNIKIDGIYAEDCHSAIRMLTWSREVKNIHVSNVFGTYYQYCIGLTKFIETESVGLYDSITLDHIYASKAPRYPIYQKEGMYVFPLIYLEKNSHIKNLHITDLRREEHHVPVETIGVGENTVVDNLVLDGIVTDNLTGEPEMKVLNLEGTVNRLYTENIIENGKEIRL